MAKACVWAAVFLVATSTTIAGAGPMTDAERQRLLAHMAMTSSWLIDEVTGLTPAQLAFRRAPEEWSIAQVIDHLLVVSPIYWSDLQAAVKSAPMTGATRNSDEDLLWYGIDRTFREKAIPAEVPKGTFKDLESALAEYRKHHDRLVQYIRTTNDDLRGRLVARQGSDAYQWALLMSTHEQRHILQIREIKRDSRFPGK
jgi:hypothetical protein